MSDPHVDTDVLIRLLTGDDPAKQRASRSLFEKPDGTLVVHTTPIARDGPDNRRRVLRLPHPRAR